MQTLEEIDKMIDKAEEELARLSSIRKALLEQIENLKSQRESVLRQGGRCPEIRGSSVTNQSSSEDKVALFMSLFKGRQDVYPRRFESKRTGKSGYQPVCKNEWIRGRCGKPKAKCGTCRHRESRYLFMRAESVIPERISATASFALILFFSTVTPPRQRNGT